MPRSPSVALNDGRAMPQLGFGVFRLDETNTAESVGIALASGYRSLDTAAVYGNEAGVGRAVRESGLPRDDIFVATKVWNDDQGYDATLRAFDASLARLRLEAVDLYLIHWPAPRQGRYLDSWKALIRLRDDDRARSIGVSNFREPDLRHLVAETGVVPALNQVELHPRFQQRALRAVHAELGIVTEAWSPLGRGAALADPRLAAVAARHRRTPAQIALAWHLAIGVAAIPKSATPSRIRENFDVFDIALDPADLAAIAALDTAGGRTGPDPDRFPA